MLYCNTKSLDKNIHFLQKTKHNNRKQLFDSWGQDSFHSQIYTHKIYSFKISILLVKVVSVVGLPAILSEYVPEELIWILA